VEKAGQAIDDNITRYMRVAC